MSARTVIALFVLLGIWPSLFAQDPTLTLEECYSLSRDNYPLIRQKELLATSAGYSIANVRSGFLPQLAIHGQATYQSDVTRVPVDIPGVVPPAKDQYRIYGEVSQAVFDGGNIRRQRLVQEMSTGVEDQKVEVELYKIRERVNQIYFGILLIDEQLKLVDLLKKDLASSLAKTEAAVRYGTAFRSSVDILKAESLKADQRSIELNATRRAYVSMLGHFTNRDLPEDIRLQPPPTPAIADQENIARPEISLFQKQQQLLRAQYQLSNTRNLPRLGLFIQGGYGRPALNLLNNDFDLYYIAGARLSWSLSGLYNSNRDKQLLTANTSQIDVQKQLFLFNNRLSMDQQLQDIRRLEELIAVDRDIIELRTRVKTTAVAQHENGVITTNDYLRELNAEDQARQNLLVHNIQLLLAQYNYQTTLGH